MAYRRVLRISSIHRPRFVSNTPSEAKLHRRVSRRDITHRFTISPGIATREITRNSASSASEARHDSLATLSSNFFREERSGSRGTRGYINGLAYYALLIEFLISTRETRCLHSRKIIATSSRVEVDRRSLPSERASSYLETHDEKWRVFADRFFYELFYAR